MGKGWRELNGAARPELDEWRAMGRAKVAAGLWSWDKYKAEYRKVYNELPDVAAKKAASRAKWKADNTGEAPKELQAAIVEARAANIPAKPCAICGRESYRWLVVDGNAAPAAHPWYCRAHWMSEVIRRKAAAECSRTKLDMGAEARRIVDAYGFLAARAFGKFLSRVQRSQLAAPQEQKPVESTDDWLE